jgi:dipeptidyl aminopeptidase/acylaminoacyl peptidase
MDTPRQANIPIDELARLPSFFMPTLSYDKNYIAFYWDKTGRLELYVMEAKPGAEPRKISDGQMPMALRAGFCWTRDSQSIIYAKDNKGDEQHNVWRMNVTTGEAEQLTDNPKAQEYPLEVMPDNKTVLVLSNLNGQLNLFSLDLETKQYTQLTDYKFPVNNVSASRDGTRIAYAANEESADLKNSDIYIMNSDGSDKRRLLQMRVGSQDEPGDWTPDDRQFAVTSDFGGKSRVGIYDLETGDLRWISPEDREQYALKFSPDGSTLLALENADSAINVMAYDVKSGTPLAVELPPGMSYNADWLDDKRFIVNIMTDVSRPELRDYHLDDGASHVLLAANYGTIDPALFAKSEYLSYPSFDGRDIHAILYRPRDMKPGVKYPALVEIHGGPTGQFMRSFDPYAQFLADQGYIIIQPNVRGSTGYGTEFRDMARMDWGGGDLEDIEYAARYLQNLPEVDENRLGVWGGSYGGYMTFMAMTKKPHLWKAGVAWVGISDLQKLYESSMEHFKYYLREQMGDPVADKDLWYDRSAVNFAHQMTGHMLIIHGTNDPRCPIEQARVFRDRLIEIGKQEGQDFEYVELSDEGHGSSDIQQKIRSYKILADYLARHL